MRYAPPGMCLNDFDLVKQDGLYHLIHLQGPPIYPFDATVLETSYGHAISTDLIAWETQAPVFGISSPHHFDDSGIWTMQIINHDKKKWMFYTGLSHDFYFRQQIGLAISEENDLSSWLRYQSNPIVKADHLYYQTSDNMAWRDPFVIWDPQQSRWIMYISARTKKGDKNKRGCIGIATSDNLVDWTVHSPIVSPSKYNEMECPVVYNYNGAWYLFVSISDDRKVHAYRAHEPLGSFEHLGPIAPHHNYAPRIIDAPNRERVILHTVSRRWRHEDTGDYMRGMLAQPKILHFNEDGIPSLGWYDPSNQYFHAGEANEGKNVLIETYLPSQYHLIKLRLRSSTDKSGIELLFDKNKLVLQYSEDKYLLDFVELDSKVAIRNLKIILIGEFIEVYGDDILLMTSVTYRHKYGKFEAWVDSKALDFLLKFYDYNKAHSKKDGLNYL